MTRRTKTTDTDNTTKKAASPAERWAAPRAGAFRTTCRAPAWLAVLSLGGLALAGCSSAASDTDAGPGATSGTTSGTVEEAGAPGEDDATPGDDGGTSETGDATVAQDGGAAPDATTGTAEDATVAQDAGPAPDASLGTSDATPPDATGATPDGATYAPDAAGDGALGGCLASISGTYVVRVDGIVVNEAPPETVVLDGTSATSSNPLANVVSVQQSQLAACAVISDGTVQCWQENANTGNSSGQLGNGTTNPSPVYRASKVLTAANTPLTNVVSLASSFESNSACAITSGGNLWCWGDLTWIANAGTTLTASYAQPVTLDGQTQLTGVLQASISSSDAYAVVAGSPANSVYCWGYNNEKQLGQGDTMNRQYPTKVPGLTSPTKVAVTYDNNPQYGQVIAPGAYYATCELDGDAVLCWGDNYWGETGSSAGTEPVPSPTLVTTNAGPALRDVTDLQSGLGGFGAIRSDGTLWLWGAPNNNTASAKSFGVTNVLALGWPGDPRYVVTGGTYFDGTSAVAVTCGAFPQ